MLEEDEIVSIEYVGVEETIDINTSGNRLFYANDILTHNSAVEEIEFDHSHIAGGISKINTADNVFGIFTSRAMKERGKYQIQCMKSRSSTGVGQKIDLEYNIDTMRITDLGEPTDANTGYVKKPNIYESIKKNAQTSQEVVQEISESAEASPIGAEVKTARLQSLLNNIKAQSR